MSCDGGTLSSGVGVNIGNFKGVMLCNRPFNEVSASLKTKTSTSTGDGPAPFLTGKPQGTIGQNVPIPTESPHANKKDKINSALSKHKKYLYDLQKEKERLEQKLAADEVRKAKQRKKFSEKEAKLRSLVRGTSEEEKNDVKIPMKERNRPMWSLTEEKAEKEVELQCDEEIDELVGFAANLDLDEFMNTIETKAQLEQLKNKIVEVEGVVAQEEADNKEDDVADRPKGEARLCTLNESNLSKYDETLGNSLKPTDEDQKSVASTILSECKSIRSVHSTKSIAAITKRVKVKLTTVAENDAEGLNEPRIITHDEEEGTRLTNKTNPSQLPYIRRNPAL